MSQLHELSFGVIPLRRGPAGWEVLLLRHKNGHHWAFPKGHHEAGETPLQTAQRELAEETGLQVQKWLHEELLWESYNFHRKEHLVHKKVGYLLATVEGVLQLQESEISEAMWVALDCARAQVTHKEMRRLCQQAIALVEKLSENDQDRV